VDLLLAASIQDNQFKISGVDAVCRLAISSNCNRDAGSTCGG